jgi:hypothetical protein
VHFLVNANGKWRGLATRGEGGKDIHYRPEIEVDARKYEDSWTVEMLLPWKAIECQKHPQEGDSWRFNLCRTRNQGGSPRERSWCPTGGSYDQPNKFGLLIFTE